MENSDASKAVFSGTIGSILEFDLLKLFPNAMTECPFFPTNQNPGLEAELESQGKIDESRILNFLRQVSEIHLVSDDRLVPYRPRYQIENARSLIPTDFTETDKEAIVLLAKVTKEPFLGSRLNDFIWHFKMVPKKELFVYLQESVRHYTVIFKNVLRSLDSYAAFPLLKRALVLSFMARNDALKELASTTVLDGFEIIANSHRHVGLDSLLTLANEFKIEIPTQVLSRIKDIATGLIETQDAYDAKDIFLSLAKYSRTQKATDQEAEFGELASDALAAFAELRATAYSKSFLSAYSILNDAIGILQRYRKSSPKLEIWKKRLDEYAVHKMEEVGQVSISIDIEDEVNLARKHVSGLSFRDAVLKFAFGVPLTDLDAFTKREIERAELHPLFAEIAKVTFDPENGRTLASEHGSLVPTRNTLLMNATQQDWNFRVASFISPAWQVICQEHSPDFGLIAPLVLASPFIPNDRQDLFLRGLHAGFQGDFLVADSLLVPQVENSLRYLLIQRGERPIYRMDDGNEKLMTLDGLLVHPKVVGLLGESMIFELEGHLSAEGFGYNLRNRLTHGMLEDNEFLSNPSLSFFWLFLRLCIHPERI